MAWELPGFRFLDLATPPCSRVHSTTRCLCACSCQSSSALPLLGNAFVACFGWTPRTECARSNASCTTSSSPAPASLPSSVDGVATGRSLATKDTLRRRDDTRWSSGVCVDPLKCALRRGEMLDGTAGDCRCIASIACAGSEKQEPN
eukprot:402120-Pelagomonas_calceolata.AAC.6